MKELKQETESDQDDEKQQNEFWVAENTFEAIVQFNSDMKTLAANAYQLHDLLNLTMQENDVMMDWLKDLQE